MLNRHRNIVRRFFLAALLGLSAVTAASAAGPEAQQTLKIGWGALPPFEYQDIATGELKGPLIDVAKEFAKRMGARPEFTEDSWAMLPSGIAAGRFQTALMAETNERAKLVDFTAPLYYTLFTAVTRQDSGIKTWDELNQPGRKIATTTGSGGDELLTSLDAQGKIHGQIVRIKEVGAAILAVASKQVDGYVNQRDILSLIKAKQSSFIIVDGSFGTSLFGFAIPKNNPEFAKRAQAALASIVADGTMSKLIAQYGIQGATPGSPK